MSSDSRGPTPAYNNPPVNSQFYIYPVGNIDTITYSTTTTEVFLTITTTNTPDYPIGSQLRIRIPNEKDNYLFNNKVGYVVENNSSSSFKIQLTDPLSGRPTYSAPSGTQISQLIPIGDINTGTELFAISNATNAYTPAIIGSFQNISPKG